ncbi:CaiB/BaiF CoA transferase family protein [Actinomadura opuntiae]|uniref:CaiB/BaiF CoA transferase family protein n=1 Tax=Actinomadura sp. OS1-43 TaxID=604315 RepID=UPI00255B0BB1|nr:CaiB/BaiF CoA-transferase family protein [Actinomadura sp. OS1-43]MDL4816393.1 CaiB/BaiF CoA-transferase family protein [Actinomadura sp. OS1-43]
MPDRPGSPDPAPAPAPPLAGTVVVSFEQAVSAPYCTRMLADLGAEVIKVEHPRAGDLTRWFDDAADGMATYFVWLNRNKRSLALDCKRPEARPVLDRLLDRADVVVQNLAPGSARRLGLDAATLVERYPSMVAVDISGYGTGGPLDHRRAYDLLVQAESGSCAATGQADAPAKPGIPIADIGTAMQAASGIMAALLARARSGTGAALHVSMFDTATDFLGFALLYARYTGEERAPIGMSSPIVAPYNAYPTKDGRTVVLGTTNDAEWQRLARDLIERPDLADDPSLATTPQRCGQRARLDEAVAAWTSTLLLAEICARADAAGIGNAEFHRVTEVVDHPQLTSRDRWQEVGSPVGPLASLLPPIVTAAWTTPLDGVPALGEHTTAILTDLGFDSDAQDGLRKAGAV